MTYLKSYHLPFSPFFLNRINVASQLVTANPP